VLAADVERPGEAHRDLRHAGEVLDVALGPRGVERELADVLELDGGEVAHELLPGPHEISRVVVAVVVGHAGALGLRVGEHVLHRELELAEARDLEDDLQLVVAVAEVHVGELHGDHLA
jgi:hypothetical protein